MTGREYFFLDDFATARSRTLTAGLLDELDHAEPLTPQQRLELTVSALSLIGIRTERSGALPQNGQIADALVFLLREAAINAVIHGGARTVQVEFAEEETAYRCRVSSDGAPLETAFTPGGGITAIRRKLFPLSGTLEIEKEPAFILQASIPK